MQSTNRAAHTRHHLSRHERQRQAHAAAFSRRSLTVPIVPSPVRLVSHELGLIDRLVRRDRTAVPTALLVIARIGEPLKQAGGPCSPGSARRPATPRRRARSVSGEASRSRATWRADLRCALGTVQSVVRRWEDGGWPTGAPPQAPRRGRAPFARRSGGPRSAPRAAAPRKRTRPGPRRLAGR